MSPEPMTNAASKLGRISGTRRQQTGMSLVELMVGVTVGLFIVAAATLLVGNQLSDNRRLLLETQLQQDMRASMDIMTRQLRRAGQWEANRSVSLLPAGNGQPGSFVAAQKLITVNAANEQVTFNYWLNPQDQGISLANPLGQGLWGFKLVDGKIQTSLARAGWQDLTDRSTVKVTRLKFTPATGSSERVPCPKLCPDGTSDCWPRSDVRSFIITLEAESVSDPLVKRSMQSVARVRNNLPVFNANSDSQPCPP